LNHEKKEGEKKPLGNSLSFCVGGGGLWGIYNNYYENYQLTNYYCQ
jgi:hypothetical protein